MKTLTSDIKSLIAPIVVLALLGMAVGVVAVQGADVVATVTPQIVSVTVGDGDVDFGVLAASGSNDTIDGTASEQQTITSASNASTDVALRSSDAYVTPNTTDWALAGTIGTDAFVHSYEIDTVGPGSASWTAFPFDGTFDNTVTAAVVTLPSNGNTATLDLKINMPDSIGDTSAHSIDVTVVATAT